MTSAELTAPLPQSPACKIRGGCFRYLDWLRQKPRVDIPSLLAYVYGFWKKKWGEEEENNLGAFFLYLHSVGSIGDRLLTIACVQVASEKGFSTFVLFTFWIGLRCFGVILPTEEWWPACLAVTSRHQGHPPLPVQSWQSNMSSAIAYVLGNRGGKSPTWKPLIQCLRYAEMKPCRPT